MSEKILFLQVFIILNLNIFQRVYVIFITFFELNKTHRLLKNFEPMESP
jgi:hypothetical protein